MKRVTLFLAAGLCVACASSAALAHAEIGVFVGVPGPVYVAPPPVVYEAPPPEVYAPAPVYGYGYRTKGITATSAGGMTTAATVDGNTIVTVTMATDSSTAAPRLTLNARPFNVTSTAFESRCK